MPASCTAGVQCLCRSRLSYKVLVPSDGFVLLLVSNSFQDAVLSAALWGMQLPHAAQGYVARAGMTSTLLARGSTWLCSHVGLQGSQQWVLPFWTDSLAPRSAVCIRSLPLQALIHLPMPSLC